MKDRLCEIKNTFQMRHGKRTDWDSEAASCSQMHNNGKIADVFKLGKRKS